MIHKRNPYVGHDLMVSATAFQKLMLYVMLCPKEIAGYGLIKREGDSFYLEDVFILDQVVSSSHATTSALALNRKIGELAADNQHGLMRFQWHSHSNYPAYFSATDVNLIQEWRDGWLISFVMNKVCDIEIRLDEVIGNRHYTWHVRLLLPTSGTSVQENAALACSVAEDINAHVRYGFGGSIVNLLGTIRRFW